MYDVVGVKGRQSQMKRCDVVSIGLRLADIILKNYRVAALADGERPRSSRRPKNPDGFIMLSYS